MAASKQAGIDISAPKAQTMTESHFVRKTTKCPLLGCCPKTEYAFISPEGAKHTARRFRTGACAACLGRICCKPTIDQTKFTSDAGPDFEVKKTVPCIVCCLPCCIRCLQKIEIKDTRGDAILGKISPSSCCDILASCICYGKNHPMYKTRDVDGSEKFVLRSDRTVYYHKYPVTGPGSQTPVGWVTVTGRRAFCCGGLACCYCGLGKSASVEIDHERGLPFNQRAHLMSAAILADQSFIPFVGCCCNDDSFN